MCLVQSRSVSFGCWRSTLPKSKLLKADAEAIAAKIGAKVAPDGKHQKAFFYHGGKLILRFGIRHGRNTGQGHFEGENHQLKLSATKALALSRCNITTDEYIQILTPKGLI